MALYVDCFHTKWDVALSVDCFHTKWDVALCVDCFHTKWDEALSVDCFHTKWDVALYVDCFHTKWDEALSGLFAITLWTPLHDWQVLEKPRVSRKEKKKADLTLVTNKTVAVLLMMLVILLKIYIAFACTYSRKSANNLCVVFC